MSMRLLNSRTTLSRRGFAEHLVRSDNEPAILALKESTATALKLAGVIVKIAESALYVSQSNGLAESVVMDCDCCCVCKFGPSRQEDIQSCLGM